MNTVSACCNSASTARRNCTVARTCCAQYWGSVACCTCRRAPVTQEYIGTSGAFRAAACKAEATRGKAGSMLALWKACDTFRRVVPMSCASSSRVSASMASKSPATTVRPGALSAAISTPAGRRAATTSAVARTANMAPGRCSNIAWPRAMTAVRAASRLITPAQHAAAYSPMLWPIMAAGRTPRLSSQAAKA